MEPRPAPLSPSNRRQPGLQSHLQRMRHLRPGLHLHSDAAYESEDFTGQGEMEAGLRIVLLLEGSLDVSYGQRRVNLSSQAKAGAGGTTRAHGLLVSVARAEQFERRARRGVYARRVSVGVSSEWLAQTSGMQNPSAAENFLGHHLALQHWQPSPRVVALAEQLAHAPDLTPLMLHLYLEARALELIGEAVSQLQTAPTQAPAPHAAAALLRPHEHQRMRELHDFLQRAEASDLSLDAIASQAGVNANTLQRQFRAVYGTTVFDFLRESRLQRARKVLELDGAPVAHAALVAGYNSAANFATAYRRRFGVPPKLARARV